MSEVVGEAVVRIRTDDSQVAKGVVAAGKKGGQAYAGGFTSGLKGLAGAAGAALGAREVVDFLKGGISAATSFQDEVGALGVIIGKEGTAKIEEFGETSAQAFGISKVAALEAAHTFSTFGKSAGLTGTGLADFSTELTALAGDLSSFNGGSTEDAITAIGSALRGENEPIRRYGVLLDDATLKQAALRLGLIKTTKDALTPQQKVLAAQAEIFRQTKDAQGDSARTADSAANAQKRLTAQLKDLQLTVGQKVLPVVTDIVAELSEFVTGMQDGTGAGGDFVDILEDVAAVGKVIFSFFDSLPGPVKKYGAELLIVGLVLSKVSSGLDGLIGKLKTTTVGTDGVARSSYALGGALRNLAGAGGLLLVQHGLQNTNEGLGALELAAGGAAVGFAVGGPLGAAIGGTSAGLFGLTKAMNETATATNEAIAPADTYTASLKAGTDAITAQTDALIADKAAKSGAIEAGRKLGLSSQVVVNAIKGSPNALAQVAAAQRKAEKAANQLQIQYDETGSFIVSVTDKSTKAQRQSARAAAELGIAIGRNNSVLKADILKTNERALALGKYDTVLKGLPKNVQTKVDQIGLEAAADGIVELTRKYNLTPKQVETTLRAAGVVPTKNQIQDVIDKAKALDRQAPKVTVTADTRRATATLQNLYKLLQGVITGFGLIDVPGDGKGALQSGTNDWGGGFATVGETGRELAWFPKHTAVMSAPRTEQFLGRTSAGPGASADDIGTAVALALVRSGAVGPTIVNPVPERAPVSQTRIAANAAFLLGG